MIDIVTEKEAKIKNIKQIGTPPEEDRIYLLDSAYKKMHENLLEEKRVYILMGHTEKSNGRYATFVEAAIPVENIEFEHNVPIWSNQVWKDVFYQIKNQYEELIIVGWGMDRKGFAPCETPELEMVHREQFGGIHQLLFLMNSLEQEENFFINKNNHLYKKAGFFIYYQMKTTTQKREEDNYEKEAKVDIEIPEELIAKETSSGVTKGRYRQLLKQQNQLTDRAFCISEVGGRAEGIQEWGQAATSLKEKRISAGMVAAIALLVVAIGGNAMTHGNFSAQVKSAVETMGQSVMEEHGQNFDHLEQVPNTQMEEKAGEERIEENTEEAIPKIPVEEY